MEPSTGPLAPSDRLLLIRLGAVGDVLRTLPALHLVRRSFPGVHLAWIVEDRSRELLEGHPEIDEVIRFPRQELRWDAARPLRLAARLADLRRGLRRRRFSVAVDAQGSFKSGVVAALSGAPRRIGLARGHSREMSFLFTNEWVRPPSMSMNRVERNLLLSDALGAAGDEVEMVLPPEHPEEGREAEAIVRTAAPGGEPVALLFPGASQLQGYKKWPAERYGLLAEHLRQAPGVSPVVCWGPGEESLAGTVVSASGGRAVMAPRLGLRLLAALLRRAAVFVGGDTGPMHLAWGVGCPVVALFGPTDPRLNAPLGFGHIVVRRGSSMNSIREEEVVSAARTILLRPRLDRGPARAPCLSRAAFFGATARATR
jgi:lipopolysaccharide heptosyltransferase I